MVTAKEFYRKRNKKNEEKKSLDERIMRAYTEEPSNVVSPVVGENGYIDSPFKLEYEIEEETKKWLEKSGWELISGKIRPINLSDMESN